MKNTNINTLIIHSLEVKVFLLELEKNLKQLNIVDSKNITF